ncbi:hypothetical protein ACFVXH_28930 [Kitasatospora sp. NPDC058184]
MPSPPFLAPDSAVLQLIVANAVHTGAATVEQAILHAAVDCCYEGHVEGEGACPGCDFRGRW